MKKLILCSLILLSACSRKNPDIRPDSAYTPPEETSVAEKAALLTAHVATGTIPGKLSVDKGLAGTIFFDCRMVKKGTTDFIPCGPILLTVYNRGLGEKMSFLMRGEKFNVSGLRTGFTYDFDFSLQNARAKESLVGVKVGEQRSLTLEY